MPGRRRSGAWQTSVRWLGVGLLAVALLIGVRLAHALVAHGASGPITVQLWPAGQGKIDVLQAGMNVGSCDFLFVIHQQTHCDVPVSGGTPVTFKAIPEPDALITDVQDKNDLPDFPVSDPTFVRWTVGACAGAGDTCTFTPDDSEWVGAIFSPLQLEVGIDRADVSADSVQVDGAPDALTCDARGFGVSTCHALFPADSTVALVEAPVSGTPDFAWGEGCASQTADPPHSRCTVEMTNIRTFVSAAYANTSPPEFPFKISPHVRIERTGTGSGRVTGSGYDCGSLCSADPEYQARITLEAHSDGGSHFVRWVGVCSSATICSFGAGSATLVLAQFDRDAPATQPQTQTQVQTQIQPQTQPQTTGVVATTTTLPQTVTHETVTTTAAFAPRLVKVATAHRAGHRLIVLTLDSDRAVSATVRLLRRGHSMFSRVLALRAGRRVLRIRIPAALKPGRCQIVLRVASGRDLRTLTSSVRIGR